MEEPRTLEGMRQSLDRLGPYLKYGIGICAGLAILTIVLFGFVAWRHLPFGWERLDMATTGSLGDFLSGTMGTLLSLCSTLLLVLTLWVQIHEYRLTREELKNTVAAQEAMAASQQAQLGPLKEQARISRQALEMDLLVRAILDLKDDMRTFSGKPQTTETGCQAVMSTVAYQFNQPQGWSFGAEAQSRARDTNEYVVWTARAITTFYIITERADLILQELSERDLPKTASLFRRKELILAFNVEVSGLAAPLWAMHEKMRQLPDGLQILRPLRDQAVPQLKVIVDRIMYISQLDPSKLD